MTDLERVARAIYRARLTPDQERLRSVSRSPQEYEDLSWREHIEAARAAVSALMDVSDPMANAGTRCLALDWEMTCDGRVAPEVFQAMTRAVLGEN